jgi:hypothetical protein
MGGLDSRRVRPNFRRHRDGENEGSRVGTVDAFPDAVSEKNRMLGEPVIRPATGYGPNGGGAF